MINCFQNLSYEISEFRQILMPVLLSKYMRDPLIGEGPMARSDGDKMVCKIIFQINCIL